MLEHGGNLHDAILRYGRVRADWLDLSTGINPHYYPAPALAADIWHRLPEPSDVFIEAAKTYYRAPHLLAVAGSQAAIQALPRLRTQECAGVKARVIVSAPSYAEHAYQWRQAGHAVREVAFTQLEAALDHCDVMMVCNPNNPTGEVIAADTLLRWSRQLAARGGWLIVDEAFGDTCPELSVATTPQDGLIVLRSVGKFFGLAGVRLGFVAAQPSLLVKLADMLGPWSVSSAAQTIASAAFQDVDWQQAMRAQVAQSSTRLRTLLATHGIAAQGTDLFQYWPEVHAPQFAQQMAQHGIWVRLFAHGIRLGLPADEHGWQRLQTALSAWTILQGSK